MDIEDQILFTIIEHLSDGIGLADQDGLIRLWNRAAETITGFSRDEVIGTPLAELAHKIDNTAPLVQHSTIQMSEGLDERNGLFLHILNKSKDQPLHAEEGSLQTRDDLELRVRERTIELERSNTLVSALNRMGQVVTASLNLDEVLYNVIDEAKNLLRVDAVSILLKEEPDQLRFAAVSGEKANALLNMRIPANAGVAGKVLQSARPMLVNGDIGQELIYRGVDTQTGYHTEALLAVPLSFKDEVIGVLEAVNRQARRFTPEDLQTLESVANWAAIAIGNAGQYTKLQRRLMESQAVTRFGQELLRTLDQQRILQMIASDTIRLLPQCDQVVIHLLDSQTGKLTFVTASDNHGRDIVDDELNFDEGIPEQALKLGRTLNVQDSLAPDGENRKGSLLVAPMKSGDELIGAICVRSPSPFAFSGDDEQLLTSLGVQAALVVKSTKLYSDLQTSLRQEQMSRAQLVQSEKLAALGRIVASVAHELNNPLQAIQNALFLIRMDGLLNSQAQDDIDVALREVDRMADLIARLRDTYRPVMREEFQPENVNDLVVEVQKLLATHLRHKNITFEFNPDLNIPPICLIRDQIKQVLLNLCLNAVEVMQNGGTLSVYTEAAAKQGATICIADTGPGIAPDILPFIFDPFFTTKEGGTGLGLSITYDIVQRHKGSIDVENKSDKGASFSIWLPASHG